MKIVRFIFVLFLMGCESYTIIKGSLSNQIPEITSASISGGKINLKGKGLSNFSIVTPLSTNLNNFNLLIESKDSNFMTIKITHQGQSTLTLGIGAILSFVLSTSQSQAQVTVNLTVDANPAGMISAFNLSQCPSGWSDFSAGNGRFLLGSGSGNLDTKGHALTTRNLASTGGLEYTTGIPLTTGRADYSGTTQGIDWSFSYINDSFNMNAIGLEGASFGSGSPIWESTLADVTFSGPKQDSNLPPFVVVKYCVKD